ncbi:hypothetical protein [Hyphomicrobium sp. MC1]|nr:hypothetical protein [Hyphomicrobium sp. MC1]CCB66511.1 protein of unknown function [Hyphomicrobium sp. MC1]
MAYERIRGMALAIFGDDDRDAGASEVASLVVELRDLAMGGDKC